MHFTSRNLDNDVIEYFQEDNINVKGSVKFSVIDEGWYVAVYDTNITGELVNNLMKQAV